MDASQDARLAKLPRNEWPAVKDFWPSIRARQDDVPKIAKLVGMPEEQVLLAKQHLIMRYQLIRLEDGIVRVSRFEPNADDAILWQRVTNGDELDSMELDHLKSLVRHEFEEANYLNLHPELMTKFLQRGDLFEEVMLKLKLKGVNTEQISKAEGIIRPVNPYRYAHLMTQYTKAKQPDTMIADKYRKMGLIKFNDELSQFVMTQKGLAFHGLEMKELINLFPIETLYTSPEDFETALSLGYSREFLTLLQLRYYAESSENPFNLWSATINKKYELRHLERPFDSLEFLIIHILDFIKNIKTENDLKQLINNDQSNIELIKSILSLPIAHYKEMKKVFNDPLKFYGKSLSIYTFFSDLEDYFNGKMSSEAFWESIGDRKGSTEHPL